MKLCYLLASSSEDIDNKTSLILYIARKLDSLYAWFYELMFMKQGDKGFYFWKETDQKVFTGFFSKCPLKWSDF